jgi:hypothetical protein
MCVNLQNFPSARPVWDWAKICSLSDQQCMQMRPLTLPCPYKGIEKNSRALNQTRRGNGIESWERKNVNLPNRFGSPQYVYYRNPISGSKWFVWSLNMGTVVLSATRSLSAIKHRKASGAGQVDGSLTACSAYGAIFYVVYRRFIK